MRPFRVDKMGSAIRQIVSEAIATKLNDPRISTFTSVTRVEVSRDLQIARVYVSVLGTEAETRKTMTGLAHAVGHVQRLVAGRLTVRRCPEIRFVLDPSIKKAAQTIQIIEQTTAEAQPHPTADGAGEGSAE